MHSIIVTVFAAALLIAGPALAQYGATQSPPVPNAGTSAPQPANGQPAAPIGSSGGQPPGAFDQTVPKPAAK